MLDAASRFRLVYWADLAKDDRPVPATQAASWLRAWLLDPGHRNEVIEAYRLVATSHRFSKGWMDGRELTAFVRPQLERALETGELVLVDRVPIRGWKPMIQEVDAPAETNEPPEKEAPTKTWIEFLVVDQDDKPVPGVRYEARLTDESIKKGVTGDTGLVRFDQIDPGVCEFTILEYDAATVESVEDLKKLSFIEVELLDVEGQPIKGQRVVAILKDGTTKEGKTGSDGKARIEGVRDGEHMVSFPDLPKFVSAA